MRQKAIENMSFISKNDKKIWENYVSNFKSSGINFKNLNKKDIFPNKKKEFKIASTVNHIKLIRQGRIKPEGVIDLHGYRLQSAKIVLQKYILSAYDNNIRNVLVITGKGVNKTGALKKEVPVWLSEKNMVSLLITYEIAPKIYGGEGALLLRIKNKYKNLN